MKLDYSFEREDYVRFLKMTNNKSNFICLGFFTFVYLIAVLDVMKENMLLVFLFYFISIAILYCILKIISTVFANLIVKRNDKVLEYTYGIYHISIDKKAIKEQNKDKKIEVFFSSIERIKVSKHYFVVVPKKSEIFYIFMKSGFKTEEKYRECKEMILNHFQEAKLEITEKPMQEKETNQEEKVSKNKENRHQKKKETTPSKEKATEKRVEPKKKKTTANTKKKEKY